MTYSATKLEVTMSNPLVEDTFTSNVTDAQPHGQADRRTTHRLWYEINIPFFLKKKSGYNYHLLKKEYDIRLVASPELPKRVLWQKEKMQMKCSIMLHFIRVCTVCYN